MHWIGRLSQRESFPKDTCSHCRHLPNRYQNFLAFIFAIEEINKNPHLLSNMSLGYEFHNFLYSHWRIVESSLVLLTGQNEIPNYSCRRKSKPVAVLTETSWAASSQVSTLLELYRFPQVRVGEMATHKTMSLLVTLLGA